MPRRDEFAAVYEEHVWTVFGFIGYRVASREEAEDLTQQTFERALKAWKRFDPERADVRAWLLSIARNGVIDTHRKRRIPAESLDDEARGEADPQPFGASLGPSPELQSALAVLSQRDREIVALRFGGDLTGAEIAAETGLSLPNVQQILSRSLRRLAEEMEDRPATDSRP